MNNFSDCDKYFMSYALQLAEKVKGTTHPNPAVGAVVTNRGKIVGKGATSACGGLHAEKKAIKNAGKYAKNGILYVTLEPCHHYGRTSPCTETIIHSQIAHCFVAIKDPNPLVNGKGIRYLRNKNIKITVGLMKKEAFALNEDFFWSIQHQLPWVTLKLALTFDGKIADYNNDSQWITNKKSRVYVHTLRKYHSAVAVGSKTLEKDNPQLTVRHVKGKSPARIVFSSRSTIGKYSTFRTTAKQSRSIIVCNRGDKNLKEHVSDGLEIWYTGNSTISENLNTFLKMAYEEGLNSVLIEGGQKLASSFLKHALINRVYLFYGNKILGNGLDCLSFSNNVSITNTISLREIVVIKLDDNIVITGIPEWNI